MKTLALTLPGQTTPILAPSGIPQGGLDPTNNQFSAGNSLINSSITLLLVLAVLLSIIYLILGGIRWITSGGDPKGVETARKQIIYAVIGLVVSFAAILIVNSVGGFLGIGAIVNRAP